MFFVKRYSCYFNWKNFLYTLLLALIGALSVFSATYNDSQNYSLFFKKQICGIALGIIIYFIFSFIETNLLLKLGYIAYFCIIILLLFLLIKGSISLGAKRWLNLGFIKFQPSELSKLFFPIFLTYYFINTKNNEENKIHFYSFPIFITLLSFFLISKQPDLGTALILLFTSALMLWCSGLNSKVFIYCGIFTIFTLPISWKLLKPYQKQRVLVFLGQGDKKKEKYQIEQSKISVGAGGIKGKGFLYGTQNKLCFLPEGRTDFIFAVICEEFGFIGAILILFIYLLLILNSLNLIKQLQNFYLNLLSLGLLSHIVFSAIINIGMVLDILPVVGIPLPFISYGLTNLLINFASLGIINNITAQRYTKNL